MNYEDALAFIHTASKFGSKLGLQNIKTLMERLGSPEDYLRFVHIAGTNGKGTVTKTISEILIKQGYKVGMYTSPFIYRFNERIAVNGEDISDGDLAEISALVKSKCDEMVADGLTHPTEFEIVTAVGLCYFAKMKCDIVVLEVGLGGRLDATNVIKKPLASVITYIDYDHMEYLGNTLSEIAFEKCGIIKEGAVVISYPEQHSEVSKTIKKITKERNNALHIAKVPEIRESGLWGSKFIYCGKEYKTQLIGAHMVKNIATALETIEVLRKSGTDVSDEAIEKGVADVMWQGRFEIINENPLFIIDGAHNISGVLSLKNTIETVLKGRKLTFLMGMLRDKEYEESLKEIAHLADKFITCTPPSPRALDGESLAECAGKYNENVKACSDIESAVREALNSGNDAVIAFGSLYMLGDIRNSVRKIMGEK